MTAPVFVDTNALIYALDDANLKKQEAARLWRAELGKRRQGRISRERASASTGYRRACALRQPTAKDGVQNLASQILGGVILNRVMISTREL